MDFTKEQLSELLCKHAERKNDLQDLMEIMIESMMVAERCEYLHEDSLPDYFKIKYRYDSPMQSFKCLQQRRSNTSGCAYSRH